MSPDLQIKHSIGQMTGTFRPSNAAKVTLFESGRYSLWDDSINLSFNDCY